MEEKLPESYADALANRKSMLPKICAEWQLRVLHVKRETGREREREGERSSQRVS